MQKPFYDCRRKVACCCRRQCAKHLHGLHLSSEKFRKRVSFSTNKKALLWRSGDALTCIVCGENRENPQNPPLQKRANEKMNLNFLFSLHRLSDGGQLFGVTKIKTLFQFRQISGRIFFGEKPAPLDFLKSSPANFPPIRVSETRLPYRLQK